MQILDGLSNYFWKRELKEFMAKMANLSKYQSMIFDSFSMNDQEKEAFNKAREDYRLFEAGMLYIFSEPAYVERLVSVFNDLEYTERCNFYAYYSSFYETASRNGFLKEYYLIWQKLNVGWWDKYFDRIMFGIGLFLIYLATESFLITYYFYQFFSISSTILQKIHDPSSAQMDLIVRKLYSDTIDKDLDWATKQLIKVGWLDANAHIKMTNGV